MGTCFYLKMGKERLADVILTTPHFCVLHVKENKGDNISFLTCFKDMTRSCFWITHCGDCRMILKKTCAQAYLCSLENHRYLRDVQQHRNCMSLLRGANCHCQVLNILQSVNIIMIIVKKNWQLSWKSAKWSIVWTAIYMPPKIHIPQLCPSFRQFLTSWAKMFV